MQPLWDDAERGGVLGVHVDAVPAPFRLRGTELHQLEQLRLEGAGPNRLLQARHGADGDGEHVAVVDAHIDSLLSIAPMQDSRSVPFDIGQALPEVRQLMSQTPQLLYVERRQRGQPLLSFRRQLQPDHPMVVAVADPSQQPSRFGAIHETHGAVVAQQQLVGDVADLGPAGINVSSDRKQQLVLGGGQPGRSCLSLAPMLEPPKASAKSQ